MTDEIDVYIPHASPFGRLRPILTEWAEMHLRYARTHPADRAYFYTEQANCSLLSAAAWKQGCASLVEYQAIKRRSNDSRANKNGRIDLYIYNNKCYYFEAKKKFVNVLKSTKNNDVDNIKTTIVSAFRKLRDATDEIHRNIEIAHRGSDADDYAIGEILFVVPTLKHAYAGRFEGARRTFVDALAEIDDVDAKAWCLPEGEDRIDIWGCRHFGIAMLVRTYPPSRT